MNPGSWITLSGFTIHSTTFQRSFEQKIGDFAITQNLRLFYSIGVEQPRHEDGRQLPLIIIDVNFKVALGMSAGRAYLGSGLANHDVSAITALPYLD